MKKLPLMLLTLLCSTMLSGCNKESISGSEAAKLLLAEERLDEDELKNVKLNLKKSSAKRTNTKIQSQRRTITEQTKPVKEAKSETGVKVKRDGEKVTWTNFEEYSNAISYFEGFVNNIEHMTNDAAEIIEDAKDKIDSNNVWVNGVSYDRLLQVTANEDVVMRKSKDSYQIVSHTLNEQGIDCYDVFNGNVGNAYGMKVRKVGNYRYEFSNVSGDGTFEHYFVADKSRGYWVVYSPGNETQFSVTVIKDNMCYDIVADVEFQEVLAVYAITADQQCDLVRVNYGTFEIFAGAISNIDSMYTYASDSQIINEFDPNRDDYLLIHDKKEGSYATTGKAKIEVNLSNGVTLKEGNKYANGKVTYSRSVVSGNADGMLATISVEVEGKTEAEKITNFKNFINETGIKFVRDNDSVIKSIETAFKDGKVASNSISWNDININNISVYADAKRAEREKLSALVKRFNDVKDNVTLSRNQQGKLDKNTTFPYITKATFDANYTNNKVNIEGATVKVNEFVLFENGKKYNMQFALAQYNEENEGYFDLIPLDVENTAYVTYNGEDELTLTTHKTSFVLPVPAAGDYELVTYIADEEGIRVSRPQPVTFNTVDSSELSIHNYTAQVSKTDENLLNIHSIINSNVVLQIENPKAQYSYNELQYMLSVEAHQYGIVSNQKVEVLDSNNNWVALNGTETILESGTYRLAFTNSKDELVYVSTTY
mgnify:CR=1 FL=1